jgi:hypothetical protein
MKSGYVKSSILAGWLILGTPPVLAQAQLIDLGAATPCFVDLAFCAASQPEAGVEVSNSPKWAWSMTQPESMAGGNQ